MKHIFIIIFGLSLLTACGIKQEENPTIFRGKVVYADDESLATGVSVLILSVKRTPIGSGGGTLGKGDVTDEQGTFEIEFAHNSEILNFGIAAEIWVGDTLQNSYDRLNGLDCSPYNCSDFKPGQTYTDLVLKIPRP